MQNKINIVDRTFEHSILGYCSDFQTSNLFEWNRQVDTSDNRIVYTDQVLSAAQECNNNYAWLIEPIEYAPYAYDSIKCNEKKYKKIFTHEKTLLDLGEPYTFVPFGGCWIKGDDQIIYDKTKNISIIASNKKVTTGHKLRHSIINTIKNIDIYGRGWNEINYKLSGLKDYRYSIVVENCKRDYWFTEKLIDALVCGCIPIYYGCPSIGDFFNINGFIIFDTIEELQLQFETFTESKYLEMLPYINENFELAKKYILPDDYVYKNIINND